MRKTLPVGQPLAYAYQFYAFPLAIQATQPATQDWVLSNYVQLAYDRRGQACDVPFCFYLYDYAISPWLEVIRMSRSWVSSGTEPLAEMIRRALGQGYYVYLLVDELYIPERESYGVRHFPHDVLVHGIDDDRGTFSLLGFNHNFQFRSTEVAQEGLIKAHASMDSHGVADTPVLFYRLRAEAQYRFDLSYVASMVEEYLTGANSSRHVQMLQEPWDRAYGVDSYDCLSGFLADYLAGEAPYDVRNLHVLWEHKRLMTARLRRAADIRSRVGDLVERAEQLEATALTLRNAMVRSHLVGDRARLCTALPLLDRIRTVEHALLTDFLALAD